MKAAVLQEKRSLEIKEIPDPGSPGPNYLRVKIISVGICGSDVHYYTDGRIGDFVVENPMILGHEACGSVEEIGKGVHGFQVGDLVALEPGVPCNSCQYCFTGMYNLCKKMRFWATPPIDGALTEYVLHPASFTYKLPDDLDPSVGPLIEPLSVAVHAARKTGVETGDVVFVNGSGTVGCLVSVVSKMAGAHKVISSDNNDNRLELARSMGVDKAINIESENLQSEVFKYTDGMGVNIAFECSGNNKALNDLVSAAGAGAKIALIGMGNEHSPLDTVKAMSKELEIYSIFRYANAYKKAISIAGGSRFNITQLVTDRFEIDQIAEAFDYAVSPDSRTCKIFIDL